MAVFLPVEEHCHAANLATTLMLSCVDAWTGGPFHKLLAGVRNLCVPTGTRNWDLTELGIGQPPGQSSRCFKFDLLVRQTVTGRADFKLLSFLSVGTNNRADSSTLIV